MKLKTIFLDKWKTKLILALIIEFFLSIISVPIIFTLLILQGNFLQLIYLTLNLLGSLLVYYFIVSIIFWLYENKIGAKEKKVKIERPSGLVALCGMLALGSIYGSIFLPIFILGFGGPLIFLPFIEGIFIFNFYLAYNLWNLKKRSWGIVKLWIEIMILFVSYPAVISIYNGVEQFLSLFFDVSIPGYITIGIFGYYLYKKRDLFVR
jgi:hypothetical protein